MRVPLCLEDLCSSGLGQPRAVTPITVSERCFSESMGRSFFFKSFRRRLKASGCLVRKTLWASGTLEKSQVLLGLVPVSL